MNSNAPSPPPGAVPGQPESSSSLLRALLRGGFGFAIVSLVGFSVWAFAGKWLYPMIGEGGLYAACLLVFLGLSGLLLHALVRGPRPLWRFYGIFIPAFFAYAVVWCAAWFAWRFGVGEWVGSLAGTAIFVTVTTLRFGNYRGFIKACLVLFACHSAGYFLGGKWMQWMASPVAAAMFSGLSKPQLSGMAKLGWGLLYGLGFGAGIGFVFYTLQRQNNSTPENDT